MDKVPFEPAKIIKQCRDHFRAHPDTSDVMDHFVILKDSKGDETSFGVKIRDVFEGYVLTYDNTMMQALKSKTKPKNFTIPTRYGTISEEDDYLVMENLEGPTIWEIMENGTRDLPESCANKIAAAVYELRQSVEFCNSLIESNALTPRVHWYPQGGIFPYDNEGGRVITGIQDFTNFMTLHFQHAGIDLNDVDMDTQQMCFRSFNNKIIPVFKRVSNVKCGEWNVEIKGLLQKMSDLEGLINDNNLKALLAILLLSEPIPMSKWDEHIKGATHNEAKSRLVTFLPE
ncbi:hypothetical protein Clacol_006403 [Clathrus columnatus]|uniref:Aminoglycoside phosphotransferase domain-containing protein n=1 Tax=Clathrus columnatus TaxID=1419009 RepID=A0AAV5AES4_9AGAM|nr:hypothetical protein Clacol_006403 [Clathrus columnatus]